MLTGEHARSVGAGAAQSIGWLRSPHWSSSAGRYRDALAAALVLFDTDVPPDATLVLPDLVEAAVRSGEVDVADEALARLVDRRRVQRHRMGARPARAAEQWSPTAMRPRRDTRRRSNASSTRSFARITRRAHLLYGEWLRREKRKTDARMHLGTARAMFEQMGAAGFEARRVRGARGNGCPCSARDRPSGRAISRRRRSTSRAAPRSVTRTPRSQSSSTSARAPSTTTCGRCTGSSASGRRRELRRRFPSR